MSAGLNILSEPCDQCPFKGRLLGLRSGRLKLIMDQCLDSDTHFECHKSLIGPDGDYPYRAGQEAVCAGWLEAVGGLDQAPGQFLRIMQRLGGIHKVPAP